MLHRSFKILLLALSLFALCGVSNCAHGPKLDVCLSDPTHNQFDCVDKHNKGYTKPFPETENFVCMPPGDFETLMNYLKTKCD